MTLSKKRVILFLLSYAIAAWTMKIINATIEKKSKPINKTFLLFLIDCLTLVSSKIQIEIFSKVRNIISELTNGSIIIKAFDK
jgi:hypothetical protein